MEEQIKMKEFDGIPVREVESPGGVLEGMDSGIITSVMAVSFNRSGAEVLYDYGIPSAFNAYAQEKPSSNSYPQEPYLRHGVDNQFPFFVLRLAQEAASQRSAYTRSASTARGAGVTVEGDTSGQVAAWLRDVGVSHSLLTSITECQSLYGGFYTRFDFNFSAGVVDGVKAALRRVEMLPFHDTRPGKRGHAVGMGRIWQADSFVRTKRRGASAAKVIGYPVLPQDPSKISLQDATVDAYGRPIAPDDLVASSGVYAHFKMTPSLASGDFPTPAWMSNTAVNAIWLEGAISQFDLSSLENGLTASYMVSIPFAETQTEKRDKKGEERKREVAARFTRDYAGPLNAGRAMIFFTDPRKGANEIKVEALPSDNKADIQKVLQERKDRSIVTAWQAPDERLIGMPPLAAKGLSSQDNALSGAEDLWYSSFIHPVIVSPVEDWLNNTLLPLCPFFDPASMKAVLTRKSLVSRSMSDNIMLSILTIDEMRALYGYGPLDEANAAEVKSRQPRMSQQRNRNT